jgi:hypothetical protein
MAPFLRHQHPGDRVPPQDTPANFDFGSANVSDKPLSAGEGSSSGVRETVVIPKGIPKGAREKLGRAG